MVPPHINRPESLSRAAGAHGSGGMAGDRLRQRDVTSSSAT
jgi:hypothetical protein